jgi:threonine dehydratase
MTSYTFDDVRDEHRRYWSIEGYALSFLKAASAIQQALDLKIASLHDKMSLRAGADFMVDVKTLQRWLESGKYRAGPAMSNLCLVMADICAQRENDLADTKLAGAIETIRTRAGGIAASARLSRVEPGRRPGEVEYSPADLKRILDAIIVPRELDDPEHPEFPPHSPRFPATPMTRIEEARCALYLKDESQNPTGNHKDRWAWEQLLIYRERLQELLHRPDRRSRPMKVPRLSMISSGSGAYALQVLLRLYGLPSLNVLVDGRRTPLPVIERLKLVGASVFPHNLDEKFLSDAEVRLYTFNEDGIDITTRDVMKPQVARFYDWLVCEILERRPKYIFVPVGTGELFVNIITFLESLADSPVKDRRLIAVDYADLRGIHVLGATAKEPLTAMDKLYASFPPIPPEAIAGKLAELIDKGILGDRSAVYAISDGDAKAAKELVQSSKYRVNTELSGMAGLGLFLKLQDELSLDPATAVVAVNTGWLRTS